MSHVDEGTLHAYLDGELPPTERTSIEAHVAQCAACQALLADERALLERASALLGATRPTERPAPPFEQMRRMPRRPWYLRTSFAWAASLVLAVGLGYYLRGPQARLTPSGLIEEERSAAASTVDSAQPQSLQLSARERDETAPARPSNKARLYTPRANELADALERTPVESLHRGDSFLGFYSVPTPVTLRGAAPAQAAGRAAAQSVDSIPGLQAHALPEVIIEGAPVRAEQARKPAAAAASAPSASRNDPRSVRNLVATTWPLISRGKAASLLGDRPVGVPGLATRRIRQSPGADSTVVVEQALDSNTTIQIFQRPANAAWSLDSSGMNYYSGGERQRADRVLARYVGRLRVEITGPVSTDSLNKLLEQVEPLP